MRKTILKSLLTIAYLLCSITLYAHDFKVDGIYYNELSSTKVEVTFSGYSYDSFSNEYTETVEIPESVTYKGTNYSVTSIGSSAFRGCTGLTEISIPNSVTSIGDDAFYKCTGLTEVTIGNSVTSIGDGAFYGCTGFTEISIPNSVTSIGDDAFYKCTGLTEVTIGNSVTSIGEEAFYNCSGLTEVTIPDSVTEIGSSAFYNCSGLTQVTIGNSVTSIGDGAFYGCTGLAEVAIPNSVTSIGDYAFQKCNSLTEVTIPNSIKEIGNWAFNGCTGLTTVNFNAENCTTKGSLPNTVFKGCSNLTTLTIGESVKTIPAYAFSECTGLKEVIIPNSVTEISYDAFRNCTGLTEVTIGNSVTKIGGGAFEDCTGLTTVNFNAENCNTMGSYSDPVFINCSKLTTLNIGESVKTIPYYAFKGCTGLTEIHCHATTPPTINSYTFSSYSAKLYVPNQSVSVYKTADYWKEFTNINKYFVDGLYYNILSTTDVEVTYKDDNYNSYSGAINIPETIEIEGVTFNVTSIGDHAFYECTGLTEITIPNSVTSIGNYAFYDCTGLTEIHCHATTPPTINSNTFSSYKAKLYVPNQSVSVYKTADYWKKFTNINKYFVDGLYYNILSTTDVEVTYKDNNYNSYSGTITIPETIEIEGITYNVTSIGSSAFRGCNGLTEVTIPNSVTSIGDDAFSGCNGLRVYCLPIVPPSISSSTFESSAIINLSFESLSKYIVANNWKSLKLRGVNNGITYYPISTTTLEVAAGDTPYSGEVIIPDSIVHAEGVYTITSIKRFAFSGCTGLAEVTIPNSVTSISDEAFYGCTGLTEIIIPNSVTLIGDYAFAYCKGLTTLNFNAENCTTMGSSYHPVFSGCGNLIAVNIGESVKTIPAYAFRGCTGLTEITIPNSVTSIGNYAFYDYTGLTEIHCHATTPPTINSNTFSSYSAKLYVPNQSVSVYKTADYWKEFTNINKYFVHGLYYNILSTTDVEVTYKGNNYNSYSGTITIPETIEIEGVTFNITSIGDHAFRGCTGLTEITIPNSVTSIGNYAFYDCTGLTEVTIPNCVASIGGFAFEDCTELTIVNFNAENCKTMGSPSDPVFKDCNDLTILNIGETVKTIPDCAFLGCIGLTEITIPNSVTSIGDCAFEDCTGLTIVNFNAENCKTMGSSSYPVFKDCNDLTILNIGETVKTIPDCAFLGCTRIREISIPNSVAEIGSSAFYGCEALRIVTIGIAVTEIGESAFDGCDRIKTVNCYAEVPPNIYSFTFNEYVNDNATLHIVKGCKEAYTDAKYWKYFLNITDDLEVAAIKNITYDNNDVPAEYYDLNGRRVVEPRKGIYIVKQGSTVKKVVLLGK